MSVSGIINHDEREPSCLDNENTISGITLHLAARCLIYTLEEASSHWTLAWKTHLWEVLATSLDQRKVVASHPMAQRAPLTQTCSPP